MKPSHTTEHKSASTYAEWAGKTSQRKIEQSPVSAWPARGGAYSTASWCSGPLQYHGLQWPAGTEGQEGFSCQFEWQKLNSITMYKESTSTILIKSKECHFHCHQMTGHEPANEVFLQKHGLSHTFYVYLVKITNSRSMTKERRALIYQVQHSELN